ncbi:MAG: hypothetical protein HN576_01025 [Bacteriovoracaceae bacterium]|jgi:hypothetical protein|nr:hypothetical protein [Bacteriovoracaceae bacterium]
MKKLIILIFVVILIGVGVKFFDKNKLVKNSQTIIQKTHKSSPKKPISKKTLKPAKSIVDIKKIAHIPQTENESRLALSSIMSQFSNPQRKKEEMITMLNELKLAPILKEDSNGDTGSMTVIRTEKTLPGSRYFHAQYFSDSNGQTLQHLSFEFRPGPGAMEKAVATVIKEFNIQTDPTMKKDGFISWNKNNRYTIWIKRLTLEDFKGDPFNAYVPDDVGTIRVAMELEIHGHYDGHQENHDKLLDDSEK